MFQARDMAGLGEISRLCQRCKIHQSSSIVHVTVCNGFVVTNAPGAGQSCLRLAVSIVKGQVDLKMGNVESGGILYKKSYFEIRS